MDYSTIILLAGILDGAHRFAGIICAMSVIGCVCHLVFAHDEKRETNMTPYIIVFMVSAAVCILTPTEQTMMKYAGAKFVEKEVLSGEMMDSVMNRFDEFMTILENHRK